MVKKKTQEKDLGNWMEERNAKSARNGVEILSAEKTPNGYELSVSLNNPSTIEALEHGMSSLDKETASKLVRPSLGRRFSERAAITNYKDNLTRDYLDILSFDPLSLKPQDVYKKAIEFYYRKDIYGSVIDVLTNFTSKGFRNDIDDPAIKAFYDSYVITSGLDEVVEWIIFDVYRVGTAKTLKAVGRYQPELTTEKPLSGVALASKEIEKIYYDYGNLASQEIATLKEYEDKAASKIERAYKALADAKVEEFVRTLPVESAERKIKWSKNFIPINYTILNPTSINITGNLFFGQQTIELIPDADLIAYFKKPDSLLTEDELRFKRSLPTEFKEAIIAGKNAPLNPYLVGVVDYRRQPYERYARPRGIRAWDTIAYKDALKSADMSTIDGINNYILKVTIGSDAHPVTDFAMLEVIAEAFDTPSKAFTVFWNHTLQIEKITFPEVSQILGKEKYLQAEDDLTGALGIIRALIDGKGSESAEAIKLASKAIIEEVNYVRRLVTRWIYNEYRDIAEGMGFDRFPKVRFDDMALKDELQMMAIIQGLIDRRILPYRKGLEKLGYDFDDVLSNFKEEAPLVQNGTLGIIGSPYQQAKGPGVATQVKTNVQKVQRTPKRTPSEGRPKKGGVGKSKKKAKAYIEEIEDIEISSLSEDYLDSDKLSED